MERSTMQFIILHQKEARHYANGGELQYKNGGEWFSYTDKFEPTFNPRVVIRIKPSPPKELYINSNTDGYLEVFDVESSAVLDAQRKYKMTTTKYIKAG